MKQSGGVWGAVRRGLETMAAGVEVVGTVKGGLRRRANSRRGCHRRASLYRGGGSVCFAQKRPLMLKDAIQSQHNPTTYPRCKKLASEFVRRRKVRIGRHRFRNSHSHNSLWSCCAPLGPCWRRTVHTWARCKSFGFIRRPEGEGECGT